MWKITQGIGEVEDRVERQERQRKRAERLHRKREREERQKRKAETAAAAATLSPPGAEGAPSAAASAGGSEAGVLGRFRERLTGGTGGGEPVRRRAAARDEPESYELDRVDATGAHEEDTEADEDDDRDTPPLTSVNVVGGRSPESEAALAEDARTTAGSSSDTHPTAYSGPPTLLDSIVDYLAVNQPNFIRRRMKRLRTAHAAAARRAATEQTALRDQVLNGGRGVQGPGLRTMMLERSARESASHDLARRTSANGTAARNTALAPSAPEGQTWQSPFASHPFEAEDETTLGRSRNGETSSSFPRTTTTASATTDSSAPRVRMETTPRPPLPARVDSSDAEWEDTDANAAAPPAGGRRASAAGAESSPEQQQGERAGTWRRGLRNVRRRDRSTYD